MAHVAQARVGSGGARTKVPMVLVCSGTFSCLKLRFGGDSQASSFFLNSTRLFVGLCGPPWDLLDLSTFGTAQKQPCYAGI